MNSTLQQPKARHTMNLPVQPDSGQVGVDSTEILRGKKTVDINHNGSTYKLHATRQGKLILTK